MTLGGVLGKKIKVLGGGGGHPPHKKYIGFPGECGPRCFIFMGRAGKRFTAKKSFC